VQHAVPILLLMLFYLSPVFYPASLVPENLRPFYFLNPVAGLLTLFHDTLYSGKWPSLTLLLGVSLAAIGLCALGYAIFNRYKRLFAEIV
jgi:ABC-type polysaccharide/polyol phosphate export permease